MSEYKYEFLVVEECDPQLFIKKLSNAADDKFYVIGPNIGSYLSVVKWLPLRIKRVYYAFMQRTTKIEEEDNGAQA